MVNKSPEAFRTISEVAETLDVPPHVLRFWETRFTQVKPVKRGGGRRYYRPEDVRLLRGIRGLLYDDGMTIKGVQKILRERGVRHVVGLGADAEPDMAATGAPDVKTPASTAPNKLPADANGRETSAPQPDLFKGGAASAEPPASTDEVVPMHEPAIGTGRDRKAEIARIVEDLVALRAVMLTEPEH